MVRSWCMWEQSCCWLTTAGRALDWEGNYERIIESIKGAKKAGAKLRVGPELEVRLDHSRSTFSESPYSLFTIDHWLWMSWPFPRRYVGITNNCPVLTFANHLSRRVWAFMADIVSYPFRPRLLWYTSWYRHACDASWPTLECSSPC